MKRVALLVLLALAACEDTRRADRDDRWGRGYGGIRGDRGVAMRLDDLKARIDVLDDQLDVVQTGAWECDELIRLTQCMYDRSGAAIPQAAKDAFRDGVKYWKDALANPATRDTVIEACRTSVEAGRSGFSAQGCY